MVLQLQLTHHTCIQAVSRTSSPSSEPLISLLFSNVPVRCQGPSYEGLCHGCARASGVTLEFCLALRLSYSMHSTSNVYGSLCRMFHGVTNKGEGRPGAICLCSILWLHVPQTPRIRKQSYYP
jgi:hypothetical protein